MPIQDAEYVALHYGNVCEDRTRSQVDFSDCV